MTLWQIAAGEPRRDYRSLFIQHDVMLIGPGDPGAFDSVKYPAGQGASANSQVQNFATAPVPGDLVLLRVGHAVVAIGRIPEGADTAYLWNELFDDVLGWDLQHSRRVQWEPDLLKKFGDLKAIFETRKQQPTFTRVHEVETAVLDKIRASFPKRELRPLPVVSPVLSIEEFGVELFSAGVSNEVIDRLLGAIVRTRRLANWYRTAEGRPSEHEIVAHCIVPLLRALGWSEQLLGVEWQKIDVAVFDRTPTDVASCIAVVEAKGMNLPLSQAYEQAKGYVETRKLSKCRVIATADESRLFTYRREKDKWPEAPTGYLNTRAPRLRHLLPLHASSVGTVVELLPGRL